jgi:hypothetical protein
MNRHFLRQRLWSTSGLWIGRSLRPLWLIVGLIVGALIELARRNDPDTPYRSGVSCPFHRSAGETRRSR